jgi:hypothetical protein
MPRFIVFVIALTLGCGSGGSASAPDGGVGGFGNVAIVSGGPVGLGLDSSAQLTRVIPASIGGSDMAGTAAVLGRWSATSDSYMLIVPVTNQGSRRQCFIQTDTFQLLDATGANLRTPPEDFVTGSVGKLKDGIMHTATCLDVGETGYLLDDLSTPDFAAVASMRITLTSSTSDWVAPETAIVPISYSAPARDKEYTVTIANRGPVTGRVNMSTAIYFDETDTPAFWDFLSPNTDINAASYDLAPGATNQLLSMGSSNVWTGNSTKQLVFVDFNVLSNAKALTLSADPDAALAAAEERWREELAKRLADRR